MGTTYVWNSESCIEESSYIPELEKVVYNSDSSNYPKHRWYKNKKPA